jgi:23S rRNA (cytidine1920-2'-O)/16S rRNA (cytidine1409-2'-O)-methyltransferase
VRLDRLLVERGLAESGSRARAVISSGAVRIGGRVVTKPGSRFPAGETVSVEDAGRFVSRAGEKLEAALEEVGVEVAGRLCLDAGCSAGGFTDVLLRRGAEKVLAVDVGRSQLDASLAEDPRVVYLEGMNIRYLSGEELPFAPRLLVADLSFIPLAVALERLLASTPSIEEAVVLVKPQFEAGPGQVGRGGLVRSAEVHAEVIERVALRFGALGFGAVGVVRAPVAGRRSGNREYPLHLVRGIERTLEESRIREVVRGG